MPKNMARIKDGIVINIEWHADSKKETETLKNINDLSVGIGDTYIGSSFYHNGEKLLTPFENALKEIAFLKKENAEIKEENAILTECVLEMSEVIYA